MARRTLRKLRHLCMRELYQSVRVQRLTAASKKNLGRQITRSSPIALWGFSNIERWMSKTRQKVLYNTVSSPELRAALDRGCLSALTEPLVYLGTFDEFPDEDPSSVQVV